MICSPSGSMPQAANTDAPPQVEQQACLCVDMDGALLKTDSLWESLFALLGTHPWALFLIPIWLLRGKAAFKQEIGSRATLNISTLPLREDFVEFLREEKQKGRKLIMVTAADRGIASA